MKRILSGGDIIIFLFCSVIPVFGADEEKGKKGKKMKTSNWKRVFVLCLAGFLSTVMVGVPKTWAADNPTKIRFIVSHADCNGTATFEFFVSGVSVGVYSSTQACICNSNPLVVTLNDPATLSLIGPIDCTSVSMTLTDPAWMLALGYVRVEIERTESGTETFCLVDYKTGGTCEDRNLCDGYGYQFPGTSSFSNSVTCTYPLEITPTDGLSSIGYEGGPFTPAGKNYILTNAGPNSLDWTAEANVPWLSVSPGSGTLEPSQSVVVTVSINDDANSLAIGKYNAGVKFTNLTSGVSRVRPVILSVKNRFPDGFGGDATGGKGGDTVTVDNAIDFQNYLWSWGNTPLTIQVSGTLILADISGTNGYAEIPSNKTIRGLDVNSTIIGNIGFYYSATNIIIEGLNITNPNLNGLTEGDGISLKPLITNVLITHCTFYDCTDGCLDITEQSDYVTVSWCKFYYSSPYTIHHFVNLIGADDSATGDAGKLHITFHHNWWSNLCVERMPRVRFGQVHVYNNYYGCPGNGYCVGVGNNSQILLESSYFDGVGNPWKNYSSGGHQGLIHWNSDNQFVNTSIPPWAPNSSVFTPPYSYTLDAGANVKNIVMAGAGSHPDGDITPPSPNPMTFATAPYAASYISVTMVATTATDSDGHGVEYYFTCTGGGGHNSGWQDSTTYTDTGLYPSTTYTYTVKARDKSNNKNETAASAPASATTPADTTTPTPNPMTFATAPYAISPTSIEMVATTATDVSGVEYYFTCTAGGGHNSGWQNSPTYIDTGMAENTTCTYTVKAHDKSPAYNETADSDPCTATTLLDTTAPEPNPMTFDVPPHALDINSIAIAMTATTATDISGVEYYFVNITDPNHDSDWQDGTTYTDTGLTNGTTYSYSVIARDKSLGQNETDWSDEANATTVQYACSSTIASDLDSSCKVDFMDYALLVSHWNEVMPLNNDIVVNGTFDTDIVPGWQTFDLPSAEGTLIVIYDGGNGDPVGSVVMGNEQDTTGTSGHYFYQVLQVRTGKQYKFSGEWTGDLTGNVPSDPYNLGNWAEVLVAFETSADANTWTVWTDPDAVMYIKVFGVNNKNLDYSGVWDWQPITASRMNGPADGVLTASGNYMVVAFSEGGLANSGFGYFYADNVKVEGPECSPIDLNSDCYLDWLDIEQFANDWLSCTRSPESECLMP